MLMGQLFPALAEALAPKRAGVRVAEVQLADQSPYQSLLLAAQALAHEVVVAEGQAPQVVHVLQVRVQVRARTLQARTRKMGLWG